MQPERSEYIAEMHANRAAMCGPVTGEKPNTPDGRPSPYPSAAAPRKGAHGRKSSCLVIRYRSSKPAKMVKVIRKGCHLGLEESGTRSKDRLGNQNAPAEDLN